MEIEAIREELKKVREDIRKYKNDFLEKRTKKEEHFSRGETLNKEIEALMQEVKGIEDSNHLDTINQELEVRKKEYAEISKSMAELEAQFSVAQSNFKPKVSASSEDNGRGRRRVSVDMIKKQIAQLDLNLQTQVLSLEKESEIVKKIEALKAEIENQTHSPHEENSELSEIRKKLRKAKKKFIGIERSIRSLYKKIRLISREKKKRYKVIDQLRDQKKKEFESFRLVKKDYSVVGKDLKDLFDKEEELLTQLGESPMQKKKLADKNLKVKQKELEDSLMKGKVLTTEDLLALQKH